jgi:uncharacterized 2Fe-2S/4Fe-4S cluster protein (DUF4445 family)
MHSHVEESDAHADPTLTARVTVGYGADVRSAAVEADSLLSAAIVAAGLPIEQPCAGRGTCLKCKVMAEGALTPLDEHELRGLTVAERAAHYRLACRARVLGDAAVTLAPIVVYSNKIFRACNDHKRPGVPLGLAVDLGSTTVAAFVTTLEGGKVCAGAAALNQQTAFGADVISRLAAAQLGPEVAERVSALARSSIVQAVDALNLAPRMRARIRKVTIVGNCAMHHLLLRYPVDTLAELPFQPASTAAVRFRGDGRDNPFAGIFPPDAEVALPPLVGGFVGSDALACLIYYGFDRPAGPMAAIDLGTNGEVMVTDGRRILVASTAAGPAFEGVNITSGTRAVDGAIIGVKADPAAAQAGLRPSHPAAAQAGLRPSHPAAAQAGLRPSHPAAAQAGLRPSLALTTIGDQPPVGLTGSGLLSLVHELRRAGVVDATGRLVADPPAFGDRLSQDEEGVRRFLIADQIYLIQHDIRELQKAKGAIRAAMDTLLARLGLQPGDLRRMILTGSFGSQLDVAAVVGLGMIPPVAAEVIESSANGAGFGAALMLDDAEFARGERLATAAEQVDLDLDPDFDRRYIGCLALTSEAG